MSDEMNYKSGITNMWRDPENLEIRKSLFEGQSLDYILYKQVKEGKKKPRVAVLGPKGTFSEEAALKEYGSAVELVYTENFRQIFELVKQRKVESGTVPVELIDSGELVEEVIELMKEYQLPIIGGITIETVYNLITKGEKPEDIELIVSKKESLDYCRGFLNETFPDIPQESVSSTAEAGRIASEDPTSTIAALASKRVAEVYNLPILIEDVTKESKKIKPHRQTIEFHISKVSPEDACEISFKIMETFRDNGVNISKIGVLERVPAEA